MLSHQVLAITQYHASSQHQPLSEAFKRHFIDRDSNSRIGSQANRWMIEGLFSWSSAMYRIWKNMFFKGNCVLYINLNTDLVQNIELSIYLYIHRKVNEEEITPLISAFVIVLFFFLIFFKFNFRHSSWNPVLICSILN